MARETPSRSAATWALARRQHGIVTRRQLLNLGFGEEAIEHRIAKGRLHRVGRGVYAVGWPQPTAKGRWMAAVLACGEGAALSHRSAAALWGIGTETAGQIDISVRRRCEHRRAGIRARSRPSLPEMDVAQIDGIPLTTPVRTLLDLAAELAPRALERAVNEADKLDLVDPETLRDHLEDIPGPGVRRLRKLLDRHSFRLSDSDLELRLRQIAKTAGLPTPLTKVWVNRFEVDFYWPDLGLIVETDGLRYHRTPSAQAHDRLRDQVHTAAGMTSLRFTYSQVTYECEHVRSVLMATAQRLRGDAAGLSGADTREKSNVEG